MIGEGLKIALIIIYECDFEDCNPEAKLYLIVTLVTTDNIFKYILLFL